MDARAGLRTLGEHKAFSVNGMEITGAGNCSILRGWLDDIFCVCIVRPE